MGNGSKATRIRPGQRQPLAAARRLAVAALVVAAAIAPSVAREPSRLDAALLSDMADNQLDRFTLAEASLIASGVADEWTLHLYSERLEEVVARAARFAGTRGRPEFRARRLLTALHREPLREYRVSATGMTELLDTGVYNCVSATLLYLVTAARIDLPAAAAETPLHVFVTLTTPYRRIDIETTSPRGYDHQPDLAVFREMVLLNKYLSADELALRGVQAVYDDVHRLTRPLTAERVVGLLYRNAAVRAMQARRPLEAADNLLSAAAIDPSLASRSEEVRTTLAWSVRELYDEGSYTDALRLAEAALQIFADRTTTKERLIAVAGKVVEETAARGDLARAEAIERRVLDQLGDESSRNRLEAFTAPLLARAALMASAWGPALAHAERFRAVSPDPVEAERFAAWVEGRAAEAAGTQVPGGTDLAAEVRDALAALGTGGAIALDDAGTPHVVRAVEALARQGRFDESLAVGTLLQQTARDQAADPAAFDAALDDLLRGVAVRQVGFLLAARRLWEARAAAEAALARWPDDDDLVALRDRTIAARPEDLGR